MPISEKQAHFIREMRSKHKNSKKDIQKQIKDTEQHLKQLHMLLEHNLEAEHLVTDNLAPLLEAYDQDHG